MIQDIAPHKLDNVFHDGRKPAKDSLIFHFAGNELLVRIGEDEVSLPRYEELTGAQEESGRQVERFVYLFTLDGIDCFWLREDEKLSLEGYVYDTLRALRNRAYGPQHIFFAAYTAMQLVNWYRDNAYCGRCSAKTVHSDQERALVCPDCGRTIYPRIIAAVIVGVTDGDEIVLTKYAGRDVPYFALIAGFTEIGETLEETVAREVMEEVGLKVKNIRYYKSQPWAMADDILMGFYCDVDGDKTIRLDRNELKEGAWYRREEIVLQPDSYSLTNEMMRMFKEGKNI